MQGKIAASCIIQSEQNSPHLEQIGQHDEGLLSDDSFIISQTCWDVGDVEIHNVGVSNTQVTHDHHHIIAYSNFCANLQLPSKHWQVLLDQVLMLQAQFT